MTVQEYRDHIAAGKPVENGSEAHLLMQEMSQEALRITMEINNRRGAIVAAGAVVTKTAAELVAFLEAKGKFMPAGGDGFSADRSKMCNH